MEEERNDVRTWPPEFSDDVAGGDVGILLDDLVLGAGMMGDHTAAPARRARKLAGLDRPAGSGFPDSSRGRSALAYADPAHVPLAMLLTVDANEHTLACDFAVALTSSATDDSLIPPPLKTA